MALHERILLATDLSARSDRALDRAVMLAAREGAELVVLHVVEPVAGSRFYPRTQPLPVLAGLVRQQLVHDLGDRVAKADIRVEEGEPAEVIERVARELHATIVVVGVARVERLGRFVLGTTVERLVRLIEAPLLIVTDRPRRPYEHIAVAVDFSPAAMHAVQLVTSELPGKRITAIHAYRAVTYASPEPKLAAAQWKQVAAASFEEWIASGKLSLEDRARVVPRFEHGDPARSIREAAAHGGFDLVVIGTRGRGRISEFFMGSVAKEILAELPCDALLVREAK
ncbi:MAG: universal stress protein [Myxococcales bacterium]|nr:universal stress protein [Myxococcales bacterium]